MISMGLPDVRKFPFLEPPPVEAIEESVLVLKNQNALNDDESLTPIGSMLANLPVDVVIGKKLSYLCCFFRKIKFTKKISVKLFPSTTEKSYYDAEYF